MHAIADFTDLKTVARDPEGLLLDPSDWTPRLAAQLAAEEGLDLTDERWYLITYTRDYFDEHASIPETRVLLRHLGQERVLDRAARRCLDRCSPRATRGRDARSPAWRWSRVEDQGQKTERTG